jgi:outer membrane autotransporter protein
VNVIGATSGTADLTGIVDLMPLSKANALPGDHEVVIVSAVNGISIATQSNLVLVAPPSAVASYELLYPNPNDIVLGYTIDFSPGGLNRNQTALGGYINRIQLALPRPTDDPGADKNTPLGPLVTALFDLPNVPSLQNAYDQLSPEIYADMQIAALYASLDFSNNLLSCRVNGTYTASINREGQCLWVGAKARFLDSDRTSETIGFDETAALFAAGAQVALDPVWRLGFGVGYQKSWLETDTGAESDGDQVQGGIALKYNPGALLLAGVVSGGRGWYDTTRPMAFGSFAETAVGDHEIDVLAGRLHASYVFGSPSLYFKPLIDAAATRLDLDVTETGAGVASLVVHGGDNTVYSVSPALEVGTEWWLANGTLIRPFVRVGVTWFSDDDVTVAASFAGAPSGVAPFSILVEMDEVQADVAAGIEMISGQDSALRLYYDGHFGDTIKIHSVGLKASVKF